MITIFADKGCRHGSLQPAFTVGTQGTHKPSTRPRSRVPYDFSETLTTDDPVDPANTHAYCCRVWFSNPYWFSSSYCNATFVTPVLQPQGAIEYYIIYLLTLKQPAATFL